MVLVRHKLHLMSDGTVMIMPGSDWWAAHTPNKAQKVNIRFCLFLLVVKFQRILLESRKT